MSFYKGKKKSIYIINQCFRGTNVPFGGKMREIYGNENWAPRSTFPISVFIIFINNKICYFSAIQFLNLKLFVYLKSMEDEYIFFSLLLNYC